MTTTSGQSGAMAALWGTASTPRPGPRPRLTVQVIGTAALEIADADGLAAVSMARVAKRLGVTTMALYRYVASKDELVSVLLDLAVPAPAEPLTGQTWRERLERWALAQLEIAGRRPWMVEQLTGAGRAALGPNQVAWVECGLAALDGTGLPESLKVGIVGTLSLHLLTEGQVYAAAAASAGVPGAGHVALLDWTAIFRGVVDPVTHPHLARALDADAFTEDDAGDASDNLALTMLLDGVAELIDRFGGAAAPGTET